MFDPSWDEPDFPLSNGQSHPSPWLVHGDYTVEELEKTGWDLAYITCNSDDVTIDVPNRKVTVHLDPGALVTCYFTNLKRGTIVIVKYSYGGTGTFRFDLTGSLPQTQWITTTGSPTGYGTTTFYNVRSTDVPGQGPYTLTETPPTGPPN